MPRPKILIDIISLLSPLTGVGRYTHENVKRIQKNELYDIWFDYGYHTQELIVSSESRTKNRPTIFFIKQLFSCISIIKKITRYLQQRAAFFSKHRYDLYWHPNFTPNMHIKSKYKVVTIHDLSFLHSPLWHPRERVDYLEKVFFSSLSKVDHIITVSNFIKEEIIDYLKIPSSKITVIHNAVDRDLHKRYDTQVLEQTQKKFALPKNFILFVGSIEPRKNLVRLVKAYNLLDKAEKEKHPLVLVGFKGWENNEIIQEIQKAKEHIHYIGYVSDTELAHIYNLAYIFIYPSLYEGFGIPPLEAMACGTPCLVSRTASLPEVCAEAVSYCDPKDFIDISQKLKKLLIDKSLRDDLIQKGLIHIQNYSWERAANEHLELFSSLLKKKDGLS